MKPLLVLPTALQVSATLFLLAALYGHGQFAGPSPADVVGAAQADPELLSLQLADAYAFSMVSNRLSHAKAVAAYHLAVLLSASGLVQLALAVAASPDGFSGPGGTTSPVWQYWVPGMAVLAILFYPTYRGYAKDRRAAKELVYSMRQLIQTRSKGRGGGD